MLRAAVLMCHAPIVIPAIAGARSEACAATTRAMMRAAAHLAAQRPDRVVVVSPHTPRHEDRYSLFLGAHMEGDFGAFGHSRVGASFPGDPDLQRVLLEIGNGLVAPCPAERLDHGALVPLWFLAQAGLQVPVTVLGMPWETQADRNRALGNRLRELTEGLATPWALLASGDMSHALQPGAPGGFHPEAYRFDAEVTRCVREGRLGDLGRISPTLRSLAREDVVDSLEVAEGALEATPAHAMEVLQYEAPFGVGYLEAVLA